MAKNLRELPKLRDSISYIYVEHAIIERSDSSIMLIQKTGKTPIPVAATTCLLIGPGTRITHAAIRAICENGCMAVWCGEHMEHFYASGMGETRSSKNLLLQAQLCMDDEKHMTVVRRMYERRFPKLLHKDFTLQQLRGMEGIRVREAYKMASKMTGVAWSARKYKNTDWDASDDINQALSIGNALLYNVCHAAIVSLGYSPALGFIHTGKMLSFVYDIADLYKAETTIPAAFEAVARPQGDFDRSVRMRCRDRFEKIKLLKRIPADIEWIFLQSDSEQREAEQVGSLWNEDEELAGGVNYAFAAEVKQP